MTQLEEVKTAERARLKLPDRHIHRAELHRALDLHQRHHSPDVITASSGPLRDYIVALVRKHIFEDPNQPEGRPTEPEEPNKQRVPLGWGINSQTGELVPPRES